jgi:hypothetical protein
MWDEVEVDVLGWRESCMQIVEKLQVAQERTGDERRSLKLEASRGAGELGRDWPRIHRNCIWKPPDPTRIDIYW